MYTALIAHQLAQLGTKLQALSLTDVKEQWKPHLLEDAGIRLMSKQDK